MGGVVMKQFNLEEYHKNPSRNVVTRDGRAAKILCTNYIGTQPIIAAIEDSEYSTAFCKDGRFIIGEESPRDLFFAPEKKEGWANIYLCEGEYSLDDVIYSTRTCAEESGKKFEDYLTTIQIEWEE